MKVLTLVENSEGRPGLKNEFGLSLYLEANGKKILFDTGSSSIFSENAKKLGIDLANIDMAILSHGHYDHCGGLATFFQLNPAAPMYLRTSADDDYHGRFLIFTRYVGLNHSVLDANRGRLNWIERDTEIASGLYLITSIPNIEPRPHTEKRILIRQGGKLVPDPFHHELALVVREKDGISVLTGCGHLGVLNMVVAAKNKFPDDPIKAVIGGFHFIGSPLGGMTGTPEEVRKIAQRLSELGCQKVISGHCTGKRASAILKQELKDNYLELRTGSSFDI